MVVTERASEKGVERTSRWLQHQNCIVEQDKKWIRQSEENDLSEGKIRSDKIEGAKRVE